MNQLDTRELTEAFGAACTEQLADMAYSHAVAADHTDELIAALDSHQLRNLHRIAVRLTEATRWQQAARTVAALHGGHADNDRTAHA